MVIDADALNALAGHLDLYGSFLISRYLPHPGEFSRLLGAPRAYIQKQRNTCKKVRL